MERYYISNIRNSNIIGNIVTNVSAGIVTIIITNNAKYIITDVITGIVTDISTIRLINRNFERLVASAYAY